MSATIYDSKPLVAQMTAELQSEAAQFRKHRHRPARLAQTDGTACTHQLSTVDLGRCIVPHHNLCQACRAMTMLAKLRSLALQFGSHLCNEWFAIINCCGHVNCFSKLRYSYSSYHNGDSCRYDRVDSSP